MTASEKDRLLYMASVAWVCAIVGAAVGAWIGMVLGA
jgi:hypothetical protein